MIAFSLWRNVVFALIDHFRHIKSSQAQFCIIWERWIRLWHRLSLSIIHFLCFWGPKWLIIPWSKWPWYHWFHRICLILSILWCLISILIILLYGCLVVVLLIWIYSNNWITQISVCIFNCWLGLSRLFLTTLTTRDRILSFWLLLRFRCVHRIATACLAHWLHSWGHLLFFFTFVWYIICCKVSIEWAHLIWPWVVYFLILLSITLKVILIFDVLVYFCQAWTNVFWRRHLSKPCFWID